MGKGQLNVFGEVGFEIGAVEAWAREMGYAELIGVDEAGRGPLAGPVVAGAVVLDVARAEKEGWLHRLNDSKGLSAAERTRLFDLIREGARHWSVARAEASEIDDINILQATFLAMRRALSPILEAFEGTKPLVLVDGNRPIPEVTHQHTFVKGDGRSFHIAAASIVAKVTRDRIMESYDSRWPEYGFAAHKGYPTEQHRRLLKEHGPCPCHRKSFRGVAELIPKNESGA